MVALNLGSLDYRNCNRELIDQTEQTTLAADARDSVGQQHRGHNYSPEGVEPSDSFGLGACILPNASGTTRITPDSKTLNTNTSFPSNM